VIAAAGLDRLLGDPRWSPHPVVVMGWWIQRLRRLAEAWAGDSPWRLRTTGGLITLLLVAGSGLAGWGLVRLAVVQPATTPLLLIAMASALAGRSLEQAVEQVLGGSGRAVILRTSWVMGPVGRNFALTMLRLHREREQISVVADQVGCPTSTLKLAQACWRAIDRASAQPGALGLMHHWSDAGAASWYDVAVAIGELAVELGLLKQAALVKPITTAEYPTPARRPSYSLLECSTTRAALDLPAVHWRRALRQLLETTG